MKNFIQYSLLITALASTNLTALAHASDGNVAAETSVAASQDVKVAEEFVKGTTDKVMSIMQSSQSDSAKQSKLTNLFIETIDIEWMGKFAIGRYWQTLDDASKVSYLDSYQNFLISSYVPKFKKYSGQRFETKNIKALGDGQFIVQTSIKVEGKNAMPYNVDYRVKNVSGVFKIRDIIAENVSLMTTQRSDFASIMSSGGIDALKKELNSKAEKNKGA